VDASVPKWHRHPDPVKAFRLRPSNAAKVEANLGRDHQSRVRQGGKLERRELSRPLSYKARRRSHNLLGLRGEDWASNQVPDRVGQSKMCRRVASEHLSVNDSARRHLRAQVNTSSVAQEVRRLELMNQAMHRPEAELRAKREGKKKGCRALRVSRSSSEAARLPQSITARDRGSRKVAGGDHQKKRHRHGHNNFVAITPPAPE